MEATDTATGTVNTGCVVCPASSLQSGVTMRKCAKCLTTPYCSRTCQKADWKKHKKVCVSNAASAASGSNSSSGDSGPRTSFGHAYATNSGQARQHQPFAIDNPFHRLEAWTWMHGRSESDTFRLLVDAYRLRVEDNYSMEGDVDMDSLYGGRKDGRIGFDCFLRLAEKRKDPALLPAWWNREKAAACAAFGLQPVEHGLGLLALAVEKSDIIEEYGDSKMPMQLRMFAEQVYARGPGGHDGTAMRQMMMMAESSGAQMVHLDASAMM